MIITINEIENQFNKWNEKIFDNSLPKPNFELMQTKSLLGQFRRRKIGYNKYGYTIRISVFYDRPFESYVDTIVHEMLHYYIKYNNIKDSSSHGKIWKSKAAEINKKFKLNISRTSPSGGGISNAVMEKMEEKNIAKFEYVILCIMKNGHYGAAVMPPCKINKLIVRYRNWKAVESYKVVKAPWSETYHLRHVRSVCGVNYIPTSIYNSLLKNKALDY